MKVTVKIISNGEDLKVIGNAIGKHHDGSEVGGRTIGADFPIELKQNLTIADLMAAAELMATDALEAVRNAPPKVSVPNTTPEADPDEEINGPAQARISYYEKQPGMIRHDFTGPPGSGKSTKGGEYAAKHNYKIVAVIETTNRETWIYEKKESNIIQKEESDA